MNQKQIEEALKELDLTDVAFKLSQMALKIISGKELEEKTYNVPLSVPEELADVFELLSKKISVPVEEMLGYLAREGFNTSLQHRITQTQKPVPNQEPNVDEFKNMASAMGFDMGGLQEKMGEFTGIVEKLQGLQKVVENVHISETPKNSKQSSVPLESVPCQDNRKK